MAGATVSWKSKKQTIFVQSIMEVEMIALATTSEEAIVYVIIYVIDFGFLCGVNGKKTLRLEEAEQRLTSHQTPTHTKGSCIDSPLWHRLALCGIDSPLWHRLAQYGIDSPLWHRLVLCGIVSPLWHRLAQCGIDSPLWHRLILCGIDSPLWHRLALRGIDSPLWHRHALRCIGSPLWHRLALCGIDITITKCGWEIVV
ncbi:hypothetical protein Lal_00021029 [Lupinus albus]|nr:hypothetical protein Lal_00021029 [Lupinus albus]